MPGQYIFWARRNMGLPKRQKLSISSSSLLARSVQYVAFWPFATFRCLVAVGGIVLQNPGAF